MKILLVASEVAPLAKTGGLADVAGALPLALRRLGHDVRVIMPCYKEVSRGGAALRKRRKSVSIEIDGTEYKGLLRETSIDTVPVYLVENRELFHREGLYGYSAGDYEDNGRRFGFFCRAVLELLRRQDFRPDILHINDWQSSLIPVLLRTELKDDPFYSSMGTLLTLHNLGYQGLFSREILEELNLDPSLFSIEGLEYYGQASFLKGGILFSDLVNTVSPTYRDEIQTAEMGHGFDGILAQRKDALFGILNGLDTDLWDPATDKALPATYDAGSLKGKSADKKALQAELGLEVSASTPIVAMVTRLDAQKGIDLVEEAWESIMRRNLQVVLLGTGEKEHTDLFTRLGHLYPGRASINLTFDDALARRIYAGSDLFLMPSRYEPCGLGQLIAMRYGTLPLVRKTGGLADTVTDPEENPQEANGFSFGPKDPEGLLGALDRALLLYDDRRSWLKTVRRAMAQDFSWTRSAEEYLRLYRKAIAKRGV